MSESTPGIPIKGVGRVDYSSKENSQQMQSGILCPSTSLSGNRPTNQAAATIEENIRTDSDGYRTMERSTLQETPTQFKYTMHNSFNNKNIQPKLKYTGKGPPKALQGNNNHQSAGSIRQSGRSKHVSLQGDASSYGFDTSAGSDKLKSNGEYEISKQGRVWCIRDLKTNNLTTLKNIKAYDVFFESKELVSVDGVFHQLIVHNGKKPKLQIAERSSSSSEDERKPNACDFSSDGDNNDHDDKQHMAEAMEYSESGNDNVREGWRDRSSPTPLKGSQRPDVASKIETSLSKQSHNTQDTLKDVNSGPGQQQDDMSTSLKRFDANSMTNAKGVWKANEGKVEKPLSYGDYVLKKILNKWTLKNRKTGRSSLINQKEAYFEEEYLVLDGEIFEVRDIDGTPTKWRLDGTIKDDQVDSKEATFTTNEINQLCTTILIPKWQGGNKKENHFLDTRTKFVLQEIKKKAFFKIGVNVRPCKTWPKSYKYVKIIIWLIGQFLNDAKNLPFGFTFCVANAEVYRDFKEILKTGLPKHFKPFNETDQGDDSADNRDVKKGDRNIGQAAKSEYPGGARPKMYDYGKEKLFVVPERSRHPGKGGNEEHQRKLKDHKQVIETETEGTQGSDLNRPDEMAGINQNYIRSKPDDALARQKRSLGDGGDGGQASPSYSPGSTGDINDGLTEQEVKAPVSGTDREKEASRLSMPSLLERNKLRVQILKDEITRVKADVIVNSTSVDLNLDRGHVSSQINKRAGTKLQKAVYRNAKKINFWEYIVTSAFDLSNCKHIFHCALEPLNDNDGTKQEKSCLSKMRATVRLLLNEANRMSCNSIALPALGTGYLGYKPRDAATAIFLAVSDFVQFHGDRSHLEDITIVIYQTEENIFQAFKKVEAEMKPELATLTTHF
ncbi:uncharacterized protein LOC128212369 isoform X6 [Mya arenaria]|uniref:uncharacterized protein LOC128212369 isoform X6 n=1 Tax=Mya arenaria TaxID=6604 RepID=UPI0022E7567C|nr:uncharacterized protein LOC128212369 isoform X6 [Mya arenaria]